MTYVVGRGFTPADFQAHSSQLTGIDVGPDGSVVAVGRVDRFFPATAGSLQPTYSGTEGSSSGDQTRRGPGALRLTPQGTLAWATFLGASDPGTNQAPAIDDVSVAVGPDNAAYVTGATIDRRFPTTAGAQQRSWGFADKAAFLTVLEPAAGAARHSTLLGRTQTTVGIDVGLDAQGGVVVSGVTFDSTYPTTPGAYSRAAFGQRPFVTRFVRGATPGALSIDWSTVLAGGSGIAAVDVGPDGSTYVAGRVAPGAYDDVPPTFRERLLGTGGSIPYVLRLAPGGGSIVWATEADIDTDPDGDTRQFVGDPQHLARASDGAVWLAGIAGDAFPVSPNAIQQPDGLAQYAFLQRISPDGQALTFSTVIGSDQDPVFTGRDTYSDPRGLAADADGGVYLFGTTEGRLLPTTPGAYAEVNPATIGNPDFTNPEASFVSHVSG